MLSYLNPNNNSAELGQDEETEHFTQDLDIKTTNDNFSESVDGGQPLFQFFPLHLIFFDLKLVILNRGGIKTTTK